MFNENEAYVLLMFLRLVLTIAFGVAPVAIIFAIKVAYERRRLGMDTTRQPGISPGKHMRPILRRLQSSPVCRSRPANSGLPKLCADQPTRATRKEVALSGDCSPRRTQAKSCE
jgi:hypothetical protein